MKFVRPNASAVYRVSPDAEWPDVEFATDEVGPHVWHWAIQWGRFRRQGVARTDDHRWNARSVVADLGGTLTVRAEAEGKIATVAAKLASGGALPGQPASSGAAPRSSSAAARATPPITLRIVGTNPTEGAVRAFLAAQPDSAGFDRILHKESRMRHFKDATGEPIESFDHGFGMCQLTKPEPTFEQVWNWKLNVRAGLALFGRKRADAVRYLAQGGRTYTSDQLLRETLSRWNGGHYHVWNEKAGRWARRADVLCDTKTGNIGWDLDDARNSGKTEAALRERDRGGYSKRTAGAPWNYYGACYADHLLA